MVTPLCVTYSVGFPNFSQPAALPPLVLRAALAVVSVTQIFSESCEETRSTFYISTIRNKK